MPTPHETSPPKRAAEGTVLDLATPGEGWQLLSGRMSRKLGGLAFGIGLATMAVELASFALVSVWFEGAPVWVHVLAMLPVLLAIVLSTVAVSASIGRALDSVVDDQLAVMEKLDPDVRNWRLAPRICAYAPDLADRVHASFARLADERDQLRRLALTDSLTNLPNALALDMELASRIPAARFDAPLALLSLDLDGFNRIEDTIGPAEGRDVIARIAQRLTQFTGFDVAGAQARSDLFLARTGTDSFALVLSGMTGREAVATLAEGLRQAVREPLMCGERVFNLSISGGIAMAPDDGETGDELLRNAGLALREIRSQRQTGLRFFTPRLNRLARGRIRFEGEIREAVARGEFVPVFQPKICMRTGAILGAEALARWQRPGGKVISPASFIPVAEEMGVINQLGRSILRQGCVEARRWQSEGFACQLAVNVSPRQFEDDAFPTHVIDILCETGLPPARLELEITESLAVDNPQRISDLMRPLRAMGVGLAIDDFGSGHANLSILTRLPFDVFKIDRQFVSALQTDQQAPAIVEMILAMAETLGLKTVAEGVETPLQADFLRRRGCSMAQGFLYSPPLPAEDFLILLRNWSVQGPAATAGATLRLA
jgi:diguanylate cyclase (GGDEF)-like protein